MPDKLTDSEIIKAWNEEIHLANYVNENYRNGIRVSLIENTLDLINRLQAENERLKEYEDIRPVGCPNCSRGNFSNSKFCSHCGTQLQGKKKNIKTEAYKELAERLKKELYSDSCRLVFESDLDIFECAIDNLLKEMVGEDK